MPNYYAVLNLAHTANDDEIRKAYKQAALAAHPDKGGTTEAFHMISVAFDVLSSRVGRSLHDRSCGFSLSEHRRSTETCTNSAMSMDGSYSFFEYASYSPVKVRCRQSYAGKRQRLSKAKQLPLPIHNAFRRLREILQCMEASQRRRCFLHMPPRARSELLTFMERYRELDFADEAQSSSQGRVTLKGTKEQQVTGVQTIQQKRYQAQIQFHGLRIYTKEHSTIETAIEHQVVLAQIHNALALEYSERTEGYDHERALSRCKEVLAANNTSEEELRLRAWVQMKANRMVGDVRVSSVATGLEDAIRVHAQLVRGRATSWESFRAAWIDLLQCQKGVVAAEAEQIVDRARANNIMLRYRQALVALERALDSKGSRRHCGRKAAAKQRVIRRVEDIA